MKLFYSRKSSLHITTATIQDAHHIARLHALSFAKSWDSQSINSLLSQDTYHCLLAHLEGNGTNNPVGFVLFRIAANEAEIITICADPGYRRHGIGRRLMVEAILRVRTERADKLFLEVDEQNHSAISLYKSIGMKTIARRKGYYASQSAPADRQDGDTLVCSDALVMALELG